jgi:hypothetical protein
MMRTSRDQMDPSDREQEIVLGCVCFENEVEWNVMVPF